MSIYELINQLLDDGLTITEARITATKLLNT